MREAKTIAETSLTHIQARVEDLQKQLEIASSKLGVYERVPGTTSSSHVAEGLSAEQLLQTEIAELR
jgi:hypothetical protein